MWNLFGLTIRVLFRSVEGWATLPRDPMFLHPRFLLMDGVKLAYLPPPPALSRNNSLPSLSEKPWRRLN